MPTKPRRRQAGEGSISEYATRAGTRYLVKYSIVLDGQPKVLLERGHLTRKDAAEYLRTRLVEAAEGRHPRQLEAQHAAEAARKAEEAAQAVTVEAYLEKWLDGLRKAPTTIASYRKNTRLHVVPYLGERRLDSITGADLNQLYRRLETEGRADGTGGLSARTTKYIHTIISAAYRSALRSGLVQVNPATQADPPTARETKPPEMHVWTRAEMTAFLDWSKARDDEYFVAWRLLLWTGMRRGEALAVRWGDVSFEQSTLVVRRSTTVVKRKGAGEQVLTGPTKSGLVRVIDLDSDTLAVLRSWRARMGGISLQLARDDALIIGDVNGQPRHPERFSRTFNTRVQQAQRALPDLPTIRLHDCRHSHLTLWLQEGASAKAVAERAGHATPMVTLTTYAHVSRTLQRETAERIAKGLA